MALTMLSLCACGVEADKSAPESPTAVTQLADSDPDGLITPDFASSYLPPKVIELGKLFGELSGYYSAAKSAFEIGTKLAQMMGFLDTPDPNAPFNLLRDEITTTIVAADWHNILLFIDNQRGPAIWAMQRLARAGSVAEGGNEDQSSGGAVSAITGDSNSAFMRPYVEMGGGKDLVTKGGWQGTITNRPSPDSLGLVYDWRVGVPAMLELITIRLMVIGGMDPNFRWNDRYDNELRTMRDAVLRHYRKMLDGVRCEEHWAQPNGVHRPLGHAQVCADVYTGIYAIDSYGWNWDSLKGGPPTDAQGAVIQQRLRSQVLRAMPLFEMRQMIDTLTLYINGTQDLTETNQEIRLAAGANNFCIDIPWGDSSPLNPLQIYGCHGAAPQTWVYDRSSGQVRNPAVGTCLDVWPPSEQLPQQFQAVNGYANNAIVYSNSCDGSAAQKWTYDPDAQQLTNGFGMFLFSNSWSPQDHDALMAYQVDKNGKALNANGNVVGIPTWQAVQQTIGKRSALLWRHPSGELTLWDTLSGTRYWEHSLGVVDNSWQTVTSGDFNGDGHGDILWRNIADGVLSIWDLKDTNVVNYPPATYNAPEGTPLSGDLDSDGISDLVWNTSVYAPWGATVFFTDTWMLNADSTDPRDVSVTASEVNQVVAVGNFDGDPAGGADVLSLGTDGVVTVSLSGDGGTQTAGVAPSTWTVRGAGDFNADGTTDILWYETTQGYVATGIMSGGVLTSASAVLGTVPESTGWTIQGVADVDHDGISDIIWRHVDGWVSYWLLNTDGTVRDYPTFWLDPSVTFAGVIALGAPRS